MLPYSTDRELQRVPWATIALLTLNVVMAGIAWWQPLTTLSLSPLQYLAPPSVDWSQARLLHVLALNPDAFHWWQPLTAMFTHVAPVHLLLNLIFLWVFGSHVEDTIGPARFLLLYLTAGLAAELFEVVSNSAILHGARAVMGASGAVMALVALFATRLRNVMVNFFSLWVSYRGGWAGVTRLAAIWAVVMYVFLDFLLGLSFGAAGPINAIGLFGYMGGFLCGLAWSVGLDLPTEAALEQADRAAAFLAASGAYDAAARQVHAALQRRPDDPELHRQAALYMDRNPKTRRQVSLHWSAALRGWVARDRIDRAARHWRQLRHDQKADGLDPGTILDLGIALESSGEVTEAAAAYETVVRHHADSAAAPTAALRLGQLAGRQGKQDEAKSWYERVAQTWPDSEEALEASGRMRGTPSQD